MRCGRRCSLMTTCCAPRSSRMVATCLATPVMVSSLHSHRQSPRWTPRSLHSRRWSCQFGWGWRQAKRSCGMGTYFGTVLNRAARVMAAGHGGQILVADSTAGLLSGVDLVDLGPRRLRDVPNLITVFQLGASGLPTDFPPLRGVASNPGNLRPAMTNLIGRDA